MPWSPIVSGYTGDIVYLFRSLFFLGVFVSDFVSDSSQDDVGATDVPESVAVPGKSEQVLVSLSVSMSAAEFRHLVFAAAEWSGSEMPLMVADGRFEEYSSEGSPAGNEWLCAYWLGDSFANVLFARAFVAAAGFGWEVLWDREETEDGDEGGFVLLTDFIDPELGEALAYLSERSLEILELEELFGLEG